MKCNEYLYEQSTINLNEFIPINTKKEENFLIASGAAAGGAAVVLALGIHSIIAGNTIDFIAMKKKSL
jgi:hypothetical protein